MKTPSSAAPEGRIFRGPHDDGAQQADGAPQPGAERPPPPDGSFHLRRRRDHPIVHRRDDDDEEPRNSPVRRSRVANCIQLGIIERHEHTHTHAYI